MKQSRVYIAISAMAAFLMTGGHAVGQGLPFDLPPKLAQIVRIAHQPENPYVLIEAHRGSLAADRPENTIPAIKHAIEIGVDWIELDVALTRDGGLVLMHDKTLDRTTTLSGPVKKHTLEEIKKARIIAEDGSVTDLHPPTLEEALDAMAGRILFRLDLKCKKACADQVYDMVEAKGLMDQAVLTAAVRPRALAAGLTDDQIIVVGAKIEEIGSPDRLPDYVDYIQVKDFDADRPPLGLMTQFAPHVRMVAFPYNDKRSGGHGDRRSRTDPEAGWGWLVAAEADVLLTDRAEDLIDFLENKGLRTPRG